MSESHITEDTPEYRVYQDGGVKWTVYKTVPLKIVCEYSFSDSRLSARSPLATFEDVFTQFNSLDELI